MRTDRIHDADDFWLWQWKRAPARLSNVSRKSESAASRSGNSTVVLSAIVLLSVAQPVLAQNDVSAGRDVFASNCAPCHGASGRGDGPAAQALPVKPADLAERLSVNQYSDDYLFRVISKGGASAGKSDIMPAWAGVLNEQQIRQLISFLRTLQGQAAGRATR
jgi:mono/diheme cytochrome c family protein